MSWHYPIVSIGNQSIALYAPSCKSERNGRCDISAETNTSRNRENVSVTQHYAIIMQ